MSDPPDMVRIAQTDNRDAVPASPPDRQFHGLEGHGLAETVVAVHDQQGFGIGHHREALVESQFRSL